MKTQGIDEFSKRLDEIFDQGMPTKAQILDAYNKSYHQEKLKAEQSPMEMIREAFEPIQSQKPKRDPHNDIYGPGDDNYGRDKDMQYLDECIKKATPGLSKIKDVDKELDEIRGIEQSQEGEQQPEKTAEEILDNYSHYATIRGESCFVIEYTDAVKAMKQYRNLPNKIK